MQCRFDLHTNKLCTRKKQCGKVEITLTERMNREKIFWSRHQSSMIDTQKLSDISAIRTHESVMFCLLHCQLPSSSSSLVMRIFFFVCSMLVFFSAYQQCSNNEHTKRECVHVWHAVCVRARFSESESASNRKRDGGVGGDHPTQSEQQY